MNTTRLLVIGWLLFCLGCARDPDLPRRMELYLAHPGEAGIELPTLLPIAHPLLLRQTLAGAEDFRQGLANWLSHPALRLLDTRLLEPPAHHAARKWADGRLGAARWRLDSRRFHGQRQVRLTVVSSPTDSLDSGWTELAADQDLVLGMPLPGGAGLLLRLPPAGADSTAARLSDSVGTEEFVAFDSPPALVGGPAQLAKLIKYPKSAQRDGLEGTVLVMLRVGVDGGARQVEVVRGVRADLDSAAVAALRDARFEPAIRAGKPVEAWVTVPIRYKLAD